MDMSEYDKLNNYELSQVIKRLRTENQLDEAEKIGKRRLEQYTHESKNNDKSINLVKNQYSWVLYYKYFKNNPNFHVKYYKQLKELLEMYKDGADKYSSYSATVDLLIRSVKNSQTSVDQKIYYLSLVNLDNLNNEIRQYEKDGEKKLLDSILASYVSYTAKLLHVKDLNRFLSFYEKAESEKPNFANRQNKYWHMSKYYHAKALRGDLEEAITWLKILRNELKNGIIDQYIAEALKKKDKKKALWYYIKSVKTDANLNILYKSFWYISNLLRELGKVEDSKLFYFYFKKVMDKYGYKFTDNFVIQEFEKEVLNVSDKEARKKIDEYFYELMPKEEGTIKIYFKDRGFGFITSKNNQEFYFKSNNFINLKDTSQITAHKKVSFLPEVKLNFDPKKNQEFSYFAEYIELINTKVEPNK